MFPQIDARRPAPPHGLRLLASAPLFLQMLHSLTLVCETITPTFMSGANQREAQLRAPSVRGALRYWLRALIGRTTSDIDQLKQREHDVFGSTSGQSAVWLRVATSGPDRQILGSELVANGAKGLRYLWYPLNLEGNRDRKGIEGGVPFTLTLSVMGDRERLRDALDACWLLACCGGLGMRSRRAAGSFQVVSVDGAEGLGAPRFAPNDGEDLATFVQQQLAIILERWPEQTATRPAFPVLHSQFAKVWCAGLKARDWKQAVDAIGQTMQRFRDHRGAPGKNPTPNGLDYQAMKAFLEEGHRPPPPTVERASFGLPLQFRWRRLGTATVTPQRHERRASPLWIRIVRLPEGTFDAVLTFFDADFLPPKEKLQVKGEGKTVYPSVYGGSLVPELASEAGLTPLFP